jgi:hypothetical protein
MSATRPLRESAEWVQALTCGGARRDAAVARLHELLVRRRARAFRAFYCVVTA